MGTIRKHEVRILVAASIVLFVVLAAAIVYGPSDQTSESVHHTYDAVAMEGVNVVVTGQAERTSTGYAVPIDITNHRDEAISIKDMRIVVTLTDITQLNATCHGPDSVAPGNTERFLVMIDEPSDIEIFVIDLVQGHQFLRAVMPVSSGLALPDVPRVIVPDSNTPTQPQDEETDPDTETPDPARVEPVVMTSLNEAMPLRPAYYEANPPFFGEPVSGQVIAYVSTVGDATDIGVYAYLPGLTSDKVDISASFAGGPAVPVQLVDSDSGCYGLLIDDPSGTGNNWTWHYAGSGSAYHNISLTVTTFQLGTHELRLYAYDAGTGARISEVQVTSYTVYGSGSSSSQLRMFDTLMDSDLEDPFVPGAVYNLTFVDSCHYDEYRGTVRSIFKCPYAVNVWVVGEDGNETLLAPNSYGEYVVSWPYDGSASHQLHLRVQLGEEGGSYPQATGQYWLEDASTGMVLSPVDGAGTTGMVFSVRGPEAS